MIMHCTPYNNHCSEARLLIVVLCINDTNLTYGRCLVHEKLFSIQVFLSRNFFMLVIDRLFSSICLIKHSPLVFQLIACFMPLVWSVIMFY